MLDAMRLGIAGGIVGAICMFIMTILAMHTGIGQAWVAMMVGVYPGYAATMAGAFIGAIWGFIEGFVGFYLIGWFYNHIKW
jgi:hypothetical protein